MKFVAIFTILGIIDYLGVIFSLLALILLFTCLSEIKNVNLKLNSASLKNYQSKYYIALILGMTNTVLAILATFPPFNSLILIFYYGNFILSIHQFVIPMLIIIIIRTAIEMIAWKNFVDFAYQSSNVFPSYFKASIIKGSKNLKNAALMLILSFLIITISISWVLQIIGFIRLSNLEDFSYEKHQIATATVSEPKREVCEKDDSFSKFEKMIYHYLKENTGKAFTIRALKNRVIEKLLDENEKEFFEMNSEEILNQMGLKKQIEVVIKKGEAFYLIG